MITVVVPVYNVEQYLTRCVDSILAQTFGDYEVILVDDGATDNSGKLCDELSQRDARIRVIHQDNGGLSAARNTGIEAAKGEFIYFLDSDDYIEEDSLEILYGLISKYDADVAIGNTVDVYGDYKEDKKGPYKEYYDNGISILGLELAGWEISASSCGKLYRTSAIGGHRFPVGKIFEDAYFLPEFMVDIGKACGTTEPLYIYWHRPDSITTTEYKPRDMQIIGAYEHTYKIVMENCPELEKQAKRRLYWGHFLVLEKMLAKDDYKNIPEYPQVVSYLKKNWMDILKNPYFGSKRKIATIALKLSVSLYKKISVAGNEKKQVG